jgi:hypothetical protein
MMSLQFTLPVQIRQISARRIRRTTVDIDAITTISFTGGRGGGGGPGGGGADPVSNCY